MNLSSTQIKDTYGNLLTIGTVAGTPTTGTLQNGAGSDITSITLNGGAVFNEGGGNFDFRVEGDTDENLLFVDASTDRVGIGTSSPATRLEISGDRTSIIRLTNTRVAESNDQILGQVQFYGNDTTPGAGIRSAIKAFTAVNGGGSYLTISTADGTTNDIERLRIDSAGNLGLGVTPSAWALYKAMQLGTTGAIASYLGVMAVKANNYFDGGNDRYITTAAASDYYQNGGAHFWRTAGSGTAGDPITFTEAMTLDASGNLGIGTTSPVALLDTVAAVTGTYATSTQQVVSRFYNRPSDLGSGVNSAFLSLQTSSDGGNTNPVARVGVVGESYGSNNGAFVVATRDGSGVAERLRINSTGNVKIGGTADRATTEGSAQLVLFNGTAPVGTLADGVSFYSASGEANVMDAAGNATLLSPHDKDTNEWIFRSKHTPTGKVLKIDVERMLRFINDHFGLDMIEEFTEA